VRNFIDVDVRHSAAERYAAADVLPDVELRGGGRFSVRASRSSLERARSPSALWLSAPSVLSWKARLVAVVAASERALCNEMQQRHLKRYVALRVCEGAELPRNIRDQRSSCRRRQLGHGIEPAKQRR